jgi:hypothetical protein
VAFLVANTTKFWTERVYIDCSNSVIGCSFRLVRAKKFLCLQAVHVEQPLTCAHEQKSIGEGNASFALALFYELQVPKFTHDGLCVTCFFELGEGLALKLLTLVIEPLFSVVAKHIFVFLHS